MAVKVQRPGVREQIALDVHILRYAVAILRRVRKLNRCAPALGVSRWEELCAVMDHEGGRVRWCNGRGIESNSRQRICRRPACIPWRISLCGPQAAMFNSIKEWWCEQGPSDKGASRPCSDLPALLDEWAGSLFRELDYRREAANGTRFKVGPRPVGALMPTTGRHAWWRMWVCERHTFPALASLAHVRVCDMW